MRPRIATSLLLLASAACGGASTAGGPSPSGALTVHKPGMATATFQKNDTIQVEVDTGMMGTITMNGTANATVGLAFADDPAGFRATAHYESLSATMENPMAGPTTITESDVSGQLAFTVDGRGRATVQDKFAVEGAAAQMVGNVGLAHDFFVRLPNRPVNVGDSWVDTLVVDETQDGITNTSTSVTTFTITGDTMVSGARLLRISTETETEMVAEGMMQGMSMSQTLSGSTSGWLLWDVGAALLHESSSTTELSGAMMIDAPGAPDMTMQLRGRNHTTRAN